MDRAEEVASPVWPGNEATAGAVSPPIPLPLQLGLFPEVGASHREEGTMLLAPSSAPTAAGWGDDSLALMCLSW